MTVMTNFRAQDMPGNQKPTVTVPVAKKVEAPAPVVVETPVEEVDEAPAE